jgi:transposase
VKLASILSDCLGMSGRAMIDALLANKPGVDIADLALGTLRKKIPTIRRAIDGSFTPSTAMVLRQLLAMFDARCISVLSIKKSRGLCNPGLTKTSSPRPYRR